MRVSYSDGTSKDMDMPPATSLRLPHINNVDGYGNEYTIITSTEKSRLESAESDYYIAISLLGTTYNKYGPLLPFKLTCLY